MAGETSCGTADALPPPGGGAITAIIEKGFAGSANRLGERPPVGMAPPRVDETRFARGLPGCERGKSSFAIAAEQDGPRPGAEVLFDFEWLGKPIRAKCMLDQAVDEPGL
jgi:hypothetical protein